MPKVLVIVRGPQVRQKSRTTDSFCSLVVDDTSHEVERGELYAHLFQSIYIQNCTPPAGEKDSESDSSFLFHR